MRKTPKKYFVGNAEDGLDLYMMTLFVDNWPKVANKYLRHKLEVMSIQENCHIRWCPDQKKYRLTGQEVLKKITKNPAYAGWLKKQVVIAADRLKLFARGVNGRDIEKLSDQQLTSLLLKNYELALPMVAFGMLPTAMELSNDLLTNTLRDLLAEKVKNGSTRQKKSLPEYFQALTDEPFRGAENEELLKSLNLALKIVKMPQTKRGEEIEKAAAVLAKAYSWLRYNYQGPALKTAYFRKQLSEHIADKNLKKKLSGAAGSASRVAKLRRQTERLLKLSVYEKKLFAAARDCVYLKIYRREALVYAVACLDKVFSEISKRTGYSFLQIRHCRPQEMNKLFKPARIGGQLNDRKRFSAYIWQNGKPRVLVGARARKFVESVLEKDDIAAVDEIHGTTGFPGHARGRVKIINKPEDIKKMKTGDILVSILTIPQIVSAMKMSAAIVTDIGGITSHAAIVSRELKKPCVIGTRVATKVLKDGDMVEVDANNGVVTKI